jgi:hypothetical protein
MFAAGCSMDDEIAASARLNNARKHALRPVGAHGTEAEASTPRRSVADEMRVILLLRLYHNPGRLADVDKSLRKAKEMKEAEEKKKEAEEKKKEAEEKKAAKKAEKELKKEKEEKKKQAEKEKERREEKEKKQLAEVHGLNEAITKFKAEKGVSKMYRAHGYYYVNGEGTEIGKAGPTGTLKLVWWVACDETQHSYIPPTYEQEQRRASMTRSSAA